MSENYCVDCGSPIPEGQNTCLMCYGDPYHGRDGYYLQWLEEQEREQEQEQEEEKMSEELCPFCGGDNCLTFDDFGNAGVACLYLSGGKSWQSRPLEAALHARITALEAALAAEREAHRWIPVSERLPEDNQEVYARELSGVITHFKYSSALVEIFRRHYTHWQPLPQPPAGDA